MNYADKISQLKTHVGSAIEFRKKERVLGIIPMTSSHGWLWIEESPTHFTVTHASDKSSHRPLWGTAYGAEFRKGDGERHVTSLSGAWETALSLHAVYDEERAKEIFAYVSAKIDDAYDFYFCKARPKP